MTGHFCFFPNLAHAEKSKFYLQYSIQGFIYATNWYIERCEVCEVQLVQYINKWRLEFGDQAETKYIHKTSFSHIYTLMSTITRCPCNFAFSRIGHMIIFSPTLSAFPDQSRPLDCSIVKSRVIGIFAPFRPAYRTLWMTLRWHPH